MGTKNLLQLSPTKKETILITYLRRILPIMAEITKKKTFSMVASICSFVVGAIALIYAIYELVWGIQAFGGNYDHHAAPQHSSDRTHISPKSSSSLFRRGHLLQPPWAAQPRTLALAAITTTAVSSISRKKISNR